MENTKQEKSNTTTLEALGINLILPNDMYYTDFGTVEDINKTRLNLGMHYGGVVNLGFLVTDEQPPGQCQGFNVNEGEKHFYIYRRKGLPKAFDYHVRGALETRTLMFFNRLNLLEKSFSENGINPEDLRNLDDETISQVGGFYATERAGFEQFRLYWTAPRNERSHLKRNSDAYQWLKEHKK